MCWTTTPYINLSHCCLTSRWSSWAFISWSALWSKGNLVPLASQVRAVKLTNLAAKKESSWAPKQGNCMKYVLVFGMYIL